MGSFDDLAKELSDPHTADKIGSFAVSCIQNHIEQGKFPANAPLTKAVKRGSHPLRDNQKLASSISYRKTSSSVIVGTNHKGARINNYSGTITAKKGGYSYR
jgi:phage gpG-like protein